MTTLREATKAKFTGDVTFMALATNGVKDPDALGRDELTPDDLTGATPVVQPTLFIRWAGEVPISSRIFRARRVFCELYFYSDGASGYETVRKMRERAFSLLDGQRVSINDPYNEYVFEFRWAGDVTQQKDDELGGANFERSRYEAYAMRVSHE